MKSLSRTLCDPMACSLPGSFIHGIFQATILEWVAISFSRESSQPPSSALQVVALTSEPPGKPASPRQKLEAKSIGLDKGEGTRGKSEIILRFFTGATRMLTVVFTDRVKSLSHVQLFVTPWTMLLCPWDFPGKSTGVGCQFLLQRIFLTQGLNPGLPHCRQTLYHLSHQGSHLLISYV